MLHQWIGINARLSRSYLSHTTFTLLFLLSNLFQLLFSIQDDLLKLNSKIIGICQRVENDVNEVLLLPQIMIEKLNRLEIEFVNDSIMKLIHWLSVLVEVCQYIVVFMIDMYRSLLQCFIIAIIDTSISLLQQQFSKFQQFLQNLMNGLTDASNKVENGIVDGLNKVKDGIDFLHLIKDVPKKEVPDVRVPDFGFVQQLEQVRADEGEFLKSEMNEQIERPFQLLRQYINHLNFSLTPNQSIIPNIKTMTVDLECERFGEMKILKQVEEYVVYTIWITIGIVLFVILMYIVWSIFREWFRYLFERMKWRLLITTNRSMKGTLNSGPTDMLIDTTTNNKNDGQSQKEGTRIWHLMQEIKHPYFHYLSSKLFTNTKYKWTFHYCYHKPSLLILCVSLLGIVLGWFQLWTLDKIQYATKEVIREEIDGMSQVLSRSINEKSDILVKEYLLDLDRFLNQTETFVNNQLFGKLEEQVQQFNSTLFQISNQAESYLNQKLNIPLLTPLLLKFYDCFVVSKFKSITWVYDILEKLHLRLPRVKTDLFDLNQRHLDGLIESRLKDLIGVRKGGSKDAIGSASSSASSDGSGSGSASGSASGSTGGRGEYEGGLLDSLFEEWKERIKWQMKVYAWAFGFASLLFVQAILGLMFAK